MNILFPQALGGSHRLEEFDCGKLALLTHPIDTEADAFYRRFGFEPTPTHHQQLILLLKDARRLMQAINPAQSANSA